MIIFPLLIIVHKNKIYVSMNLLILQRNLMPFSFTTEIKRATVDT